MLPSFSVFLFYIHLCLVSDTKILAVTGALYMDSFFVLRLKSTGKILQDLCHLSSVLKPAFSFAIGVVPECAVFELT